MAALNRYRTHMGMAPLRAGPPRSPGRGCTRRRRRRVGVPPLDLLYGKIVLFTLYTHLPTLITVTQRSREWLWPRAVHMSYTLH